MSFPDPREFQSGAHNMLRKGFADGHRVQMLMAPTGAGKTYLGLRVINEAIQKGRRGIFVCDRTTLIEQTSAVADRYGMHEHGVIQADHWRRNDHPFQICSVQTIAARQWPKADVIVIDEAHTMYKTWTDHALTTNAAVIGLSATPFSTGLGKIFTNLVNATTMHDLTESGVLVPMRVLSCTRANMDGAKIVAGEWSDAVAEERGLGIVGDVVSEWKQYAENRKSICFGATIKHCEELARQFVSAGVMAAVFTSHTTDAERKMLLDEFSKEDSALRVLISVEALAKGFDVPSVSCVIDCRPLRKSLSTAIQMWGRGLRCAPGKTDCILMDHSGNILRFLKDYEEVYFNGLDSLDDGEKLDRQPRVDDKKDDEEKKCPSCGYKPFAVRCMSCGFEYRSVTQVEHEASSGITEIRIGKSKVADSQKELWSQLCSYADQHSAPEKALWRARYLFKDVVGTMPPTTWVFNPGAKVPRALVNKILSQNIAYRKAMQKAGVRA